MSHFGSIIICIYPNDYKPIISSLVPSGALIFFNTLDPKLTRASPTNHNKTDGKLCTDNFSLLLMICVTVYLYIFKRNGSSDQQSYVYLFSNKVRLHQ